MTSHLFFLLCLITISGATITRIIRKPHESNNVAQRTITVEKKSISVDREPEPVPIQRDSFDREKVEEQRKLLNHQALVHYTNRDVYKKQREQYRKEQQAQRDRYYDQYFDRMRDYGKNLQRQRYMQMLQKQAQERAEQEKSMNYWGADSGDMRPAETTNSEQSSRPSDPFGSAPSSSGGQRSRSNERSARPLPILPSAMEPKVGKEASHRQAVALQGLCQRFLPTVRKHCYGEHAEKKYEKKCKGYFQDCQQYVTKGDPLYAIAHAVDSSVGVNLGWAVKGIPYYPINEEGAIGSGYQMNVPFGSWGGGYSDNIGVRDYWSQYQEVGANWYEGKYGYKSGWSVPLVQSLGVEGDTHAVVSVPIKEGELGKPIGVDVGGGVGPYYQQNHHVGVDYMNGQVGSNLGIGVPMAGVGFNTGWGVKFPSINDFAAAPALIEAARPEP